MTGHWQVGTRSSRWACTCVVGPKTIADVPGIPKPDTKLLAGCRERGRSHVFDIMRSLPPARWPHGARGGSGLLFLKSRGLGNPRACLQGRARSSRRLALALVGLDPGSVAFHRVWWPRGSQGELLHQMYPGAWDGKKSGSGPERN